MTPKATLGSYKGLEVGRRSPEVPAEASTRSSSTCASGSRASRPSTAPLAEGDIAVVDFVGKVDGEPFEGGEARDYMLEIGGGRLVEGFEEQLVGAKAGESRTVEIDFPDDYRAEDLAGKHAVFEVDVKDVREKELPELDDDFASEASEFDTLEELRADIEHKLTHAQEHSIEDEFREAVVDAAVDEASVDLPDELVDGARRGDVGPDGARAARQGIDPETYFATSGKTRERGDRGDEAGRRAPALARERARGRRGRRGRSRSTTRSCWRRLRRAAERERAKPEKLLERLEKSGRDVPIRREIRLRKAVDLMVESAEAIDAEQAKARDKIWTPDKQRKEKGSAQLWTPESRRAKASRPASRSSSRTSPRKPRADDSALAREGRRGDRRKLPP